MADLELQDVNGNTIVTIARNHSYPWPQRYETNVAVGLTVGGKARSSRRGESRLVNRLTFQMMGATQAAQMMRILSEYAGGA